MKNFIQRWIPRMFLPENRIPLSTQNKTLLQNELECCFTLGGLDQIKGILLLCARDFSTKELVEFNMNIDYRRRMIKYVESKLLRPYYHTHEIASMIIGAKSRIQVDAIMMHIEMNKEIYNNRVQGMEIYKSMASKKNAQLLLDLQKLSA